MTKNKKVKVKEDHISFPASVLRPVNNFLHEQLQKIEKQRKEVEEGDPFSNGSRAEDNAALDTEAEEQFGHATSSALKDQLDKRRIQIRKALTRIKIGKYGICENCGQMIDTDRLMVYPEATRCVNCEKKR